MAFNWLRQLDGLLRGEKTDTQTLRTGTINVPLRVFVPTAVALGCTYGFFMGWFALTNRTLQNPDAWKQAIACIVKLPALFLLTLLVTFPSLYVFNALIGCRLTFKAAMRLLVAAIVVNLAVAASLGPILAFFTVSTTSYSFMVLLNVALLAIAGFVGLGFLLRTLQRLELVGTEAAPAGAGDGDAINPDTRLPRARIEEGAASGIFKVWLIIYALVGAQMGWLLRPFIGSPDLPFQWFRVREGNFFLAIFEHLRHMAGL